MSLLHLEDLQLRIDLSITKEELLRVADYVHVPAHLGPDAELSLIREALRSYVRQCLERSTHKLACELADKMVGR